MSAAGNDRHAELREYAQKIAAQAPPLTPGQCARLAVLLRLEPAAIVRPKRRAA